MGNNSDKLDNTTEYRSTSYSDGENPKIFVDSLSLPNFMQQWIEDNLNDVILVWNDHGKGIYFSKSIERVLGYKASDLYGTSWMDLISPEDRLYVEDYFCGTVNTEGVLSLNFRTSGGRYKWCECKVARVIDDSNKQLYYLTTLRDASDKKETEEMMVRSEKMSIAGQLAAGVAHEIRNPLTSIKGFLQLLQAGVNRKEVYYKIMIDEIEKMEKITSELLFISKPLTDEKKEESVSEMVEDVIKLLKSQAKLKNIEIIHKSKQACNINCDKSQIKQVILNLIKNAVEAMEEPGTIKVAVESTDMKIQLDIVDEGPGIPEEVIHKLGEPFFTTKQNGTGLGLMITKQILERHNATLEILRNEDKGSTFRIRFPAII